MKSFTKLEPQSHKGETNTWLTPLFIVEALGEFDLDPCAFPDHKTARNLICLPDDGLKADWKGRVWLNPPYGVETKEWLEKLASHGNGVALVFARTDTKWFQEVVKQASAVKFVAGRIKFLRPDFSSDTNAGAPSCLIAFGYQDLSGIRGIELVRKTTSEAKETGE